MTESTAVTRQPPSPATPATGSVCPYLMAAEGGWRSSSPAREHRCTAVAPPAVLATDKQRRLCLAEAHRGCATFLASSGAIDVEPAERQGSLDRGARPGRPLVRTAPLVMDHGRLSAVPSVRVGRDLGQGALLAMMAIAFAVILIARFTSEPGSGAGAVATGSPSPSPDATRAVATGAPAPSAPTPTATPIDGPTPAPSVTPGPSPAGTDHATTYTVRRGDTLSGIAAEFGTSVKELADLNDIADPSRLRVGQVLRLP